MKPDYPDQRPVRSHLTRSRLSLPAKVGMVLLLFILGVVTLSHWSERSLLGRFLPLSTQNQLSPDDARVVRHYNLTVGSRWMNPGTSISQHASCHEHHLLLSTWPSCSDTIFLPGLTGEQMGVVGVSCSSATDRRRAQLSLPKKGILFSSQYIMTCTLSQQYIGRLFLDLHKNFKFSTNMSISKVRPDLQKVNIPFGLLQHHSLVLHADCPFSHHSGPWNDGTPGISQVYFQARKLMAGFELTNKTAQFSMLPRGNWSSVHDTTGKWGLNWYVEHATAGSADVSRTSVELFPCRHQDHVHA